MALMGLCLLLEFIGGIVILVYGVEESDVLTNDLKEVFFKLIYRMDHDERANRILKIVQEYVSKRDFFLNYNQETRMVIHNIRIDKIM